MYTQESILDILFLMLYGGAGMAGIATGDGRLRVGRRLDHAQGLPAL